MGQGFTLLAKTMVITVGTEDTTVSRSRPQSGTTTGTLVKNQSVIWGNR